MTAAEPARVLGYYSISPGAVEFAKVPAALTQKPGRYEVPVFCLRRLAVDLTVQGPGLGGDLLLVAGMRTLAVVAEVASPWPSTSGLNRRQSGTCVSARLPCSMIPSS